VTPTDTEELELLFNADIVDRFVNTAIQIVLYVRLFDRFKTLLFPL